MDFVVLHLGQSVAYLKILNANSGTAHILSWVTQMEKQDVHIESNYKRRLWQADRASIEMNLFYPCLDQVLRRRAYQWVSCTYANRWEWLFVFSARFMLLLDKGHIVRYISLDGIPVFSNVLCILEDKPNWIDRNGTFYLWENRQPFVYAQCLSYDAYRSNDLPTLDEIIQYTRTPTGSLLPIRRCTHM